MKKSGRDFFEEEAEEGEEEMVTDISNDASSDAPLTPILLKYQIMRRKYNELRVEMGNLEKELSWMIQHSMEHCFDNNIKCNHTFVGRRRVIVADCGEALDKTFGR